MEKDSTKTHIKDDKRDLEDGLKDIPEEVKQEISKVQDLLGKLKTEIVKKYPYIQAIGIVPPVASELIEEEEEIQKEKDEKIVHALILIPDEKLKDIPKITSEAIAFVKDSKPKIWIHIKTVSDLWEVAFDGKYQLMEALSMSFPIYDKGILGGIRAASIHKMLTLKKFERYVTNYVIAGSFVRGTTVKTSDIDIAIIIDDTDVKRMSRYELKEKLRAIIYTYALEASEKAGVKNKLSPQVYLLTEFWEAVKDAHPVIFTFIRDGVPLYDRGAFMPWKLLLRMGKIKPSPEAIDMFMSLGEKVADNVKRKLNEILIDDIYWGVITPSQAVLMLYGLSPPTPRETYTLMKEIFVKKEKLLEPKYAATLEKIVEIYKKYEHEKLKSISGKEIDELLAECADYIKRLKQLMEQIEKRTTENEIIQHHKSSFDLLKSIFGNYSEQQLIGKLDKELIAKGKIPRRNLIAIMKVSEYKKKIKTRKFTKQETGDLRKDVHDFMSSLLEYAQRKEMAEISKKKVDITYENKKGELFIFKEVVFFVPDFTAEKIKKIHSDGKVEEVEREDIKEYLSSHNSEKKINTKWINTLKKIIGEFEINL